MEYQLLPIIAFKHRQTEKTELQVNKEKDETVKTVLKLLKLLLAAKALDFKTQ